MIKQRTLKSVVRATGVGTHSGKTVYITIRPAPIDTGIVFNRTDLPEVVSIPAKPEYIAPSSLCTAIAKNDVKINTVEHLLSALAGLGVDNAYIDLTAPEVPIMDGSALSFVLLIQSVGIKEQNKAKRFIRIKEKVKVSDGDKYAYFEPYDGYKVSFRIDFKHPVFLARPQTASFDFSTASYVKEVSRARTFGFISDYELLRENNLALGASLDNTIVVDDYRIMNEGDLRYEDEFVKHKILDAIGDTYLLGHHLIGAFHGHKSGHGLNHQLIKTLEARQSAWEYVTFEDTQAAPANYYPATLCATDI